MGVSGTFDEGSIPSSATLHKTLAERGFCVSCRIVKSNLHLDFIKILSSRMLSLSYYMAIV